MINVSSCEVITLKPKSCLGPIYGDRPPKIQLFMKSSHPIDVILIGQNNYQQLQSDGYETVQDLGGIRYTNQCYLNRTVQLPEDWSSNWVLVLANASEEAIGVVYGVVYAES